MRNRQLPWWTLPVCTGLVPIYLLARGGAFWFVLSAVAWSAQLALVWVAKAPGLKRIDRINTALSVVALAASLTVLDRELLYKRQALRMTVLREVFHDDIASVELAFSNPGTRHVLLDVVRTMRVAEQNPNWTGYELGDPERPPGLPCLIRPGETVLVLSTGAFVPSTAWKEGISVPADLQARAPATRRVPFGFLVRVVDSEGQRVERKIIVFDVMVDSVRVTSWKGIAKEPVELLH